MMSLVHAYQKTFPKQYILDYVPISWHIYINIMPLGRNRSKGMVCQSKRQHFSWARSEMQPVTFFRDRAGSWSNSARADRTGMSHQGIFSLEITHSF